MEKEDKIKEILEDLRHLRYDWSEKIPKKEIHNEGLYKIRVGWESAVQGNLVAAEMTGLLYKNGLNAYQAFIKYRDKRGEQNLRTREDINEGNKVLDAVIGDLEKRLEETSKPKTNSTPLIAIPLLGLGTLTLMNNITGNTISNLNNTANNLLGIILIAFGSIATLIYFKKNKK